MVRTSDFRLLVASSIPGHNTSFDISEISDHFFEGKLSWNLNHLDQPSLLGSLNRVVASAGVKAGKSALQVTLCDSSLPFLLFKSKMRRITIKQI